MTLTDMKKVVEGIAGLRGVFVTLMPDCLLFDSWMRQDSEWVAEDVASYFGDLVRSNREGLKALSAWAADMQVTIESADTLVVLRELEGGLVVSYVFDRQTPIGMVRLNVKRLMVRLKVALPSVELEERPRVDRILDYLNRYAPDPHAVLMRVALQTGIALEDLERPERLNDAQTDDIEESVKSILGLDTLAA
jgi:hypothetical protein